MKISKTRLRKLIREAIGPTDIDGRGRVPSTPDEGVDHEMYAEFVTNIRDGGPGWIDETDVKRQWDDMFNDDIDASSHGDLLDMLADDELLFDGDMTPVSSRTPEFKHDVDLRWQPSSGGYNDTYVAQHSDWRSRL